MAGAKAAYHAVNSGWYSEDEDEFEEAMSTLSEPSARQSLSSEDLREQVPSADATAGVPLSANQAASLWPGHDAVYSNASDRLRTLLSSNTISVHALDPVGNTMLHIAAIRNAPECARILLEHGADPAQKNNSDWSALNEALVCRSAETAKLLHSAQENHSRSNCRSHWPKLLETLRTVADFSMHVKWEFGSSIAGPLLRKHMPNDCQAVYKKGLSLRIDGTFNGFEEDTRRMLPRLSRGNYSVVFCGSETSRKPSLLFIDRAEQCYCEMLEPGGPLDKPVLSDNDVSESVRKLMLERPKKRRFKACGFELRPVTSWRGESPRVERIEGWDAHVYDVNSIFKRTERGSPTSNLQGETFAEYIAHGMARNYPTKTKGMRPAGPDVKSGIGSFLLKSSMSNKSDHRSLRRGRVSNGGRRQSDAETAAKERGSRHRDSVIELRGRCWFVQNFPLKATDLLPIFNLMGRVNKHFKKVERFLEQWQDVDMFPVHIKVPLAFTIHALISCTQFSKATLPDSLFQPPEEFKQIPPWEMFNAPDV